MCEFESSEVSHTLTRPEIVVNLYAKILQFAGILTYCTRLQ